ncbi:MAG: MFS transporter [Nanoarchaeota archaeon]|nr:MFS transporter [Nanoarchaeota archaeon]
MGIMIRKQKEFFGLTGIAKLSIISLIVSLASSFVITIWALYMDSFIHSIVYVGFFSALLTFISVTSFFLLIPIIEKTNKSKLYVFSLFLFGITYLIFSFNISIYLFAILAIITAIIGTVRMTSFGIMVKDKSPKTKLSRNEGLVYTFANLSFVIGPLIAGFIASKYGLGKVFLFASVFIFLSILIFKISGIKDANIKKKADTNIMKNFFDFFKNKQRVTAYMLGGGVNLWWVLIYLFMPLYIIRNELDKIWIGYFLFAVAVPLIFLGYFFSKLAGKIGFRKIFKIGFLIPCLLAFACFFINSVYIILALLVIASIGLSMLEATTEAYFFDITKDKEEQRFYGPYNTTIELNNLIGKLIPSIFLIFLPFKFVFLLFSFFMFIMFLISHKVKNIVEDGK